MAEPRAANVWPVLALMFNALVWGVSWWPFRELQARGLHPLWSTALIYLLSLACLLAVRPGALRSFAGQPLLWLLLAASGLTNVGFNWAVTVGDVVRVVLLFYLMPAWTVLLAWPLLGEKPTAGALARLALALAGVFIVLQPGAGGWPMPQEAADWLALLGGFCFALTNILLRKLQHAPAEARIAAMFGGGALMAIAAGLLGVAQGIVTAPPSPSLGWAVFALTLGLGFLCGNIALQYGAARLSAHTTALVMLSEVIFASASSVALGAAELTSRTWVGGALILAAAAWSAWPERQARAEVVIGAK
ncbi:MAG: putative transporter [Ramlibacter sp.]|jgi:drug/metabolite transporter (DMT)-like permease|nr:putative transporter [Ramlibacter sp.]